MTASCWMCGRALWVGRDRRDRFSAGCMCCNVETDSDTREGAIEAWRTGPWYGLKRDVEYVEARRKEVRE